MTKNLFILISLVKLLHSHRRYSRKHFFSIRFLECKVEAIQNGHPYVSQNQEFLSPFWKHIIALFHLFSSYILSVYAPSRHPRNHLAKRDHFEGENVENFSIFKSAQNFILINLPWSKKIEKNLERHLVAYVIHNVTFKRPCTS